MKIKILKNIKYNNSLYKKGEVIDIEENDIKEFTDKNIIDIEQLEDIEEAKEDGIPKQHLSEDNKDINTIAYDDLTKSYIVDILAEKGIDHNPRDKKDVLYKLMIEGE